MRRAASQLRQCDGVCAAGGGPEVSEALVDAWRLTLWGHQKPCDLDGKYIDFSAKRWWIADFDQLMTFWPSHPLRGLNQLNQLNDSEPMQMQGGSQALASMP